MDYTKIPTDELEQMQNELQSEFYECEEDEKRQNQIELELDMIEAELTRRDPFAEE